MVIPVIDAHPLFHGAMKLSAGASTGIEEGEQRKIWILDQPSPPLSKESLHRTEEESSQIFWMADSQVSSDAFSASECKCKCKFDPQTTSFDQPTRDALFQMSKWLKLIETTPSLAVHF